MAIYYNAITQKAELAFRAYLRSAPLSQWTIDDIYAGINNWKKKVPSVVCICQRAIPETKVGPGNNWMCEVEIRVAVNAMDEPAENLAQEAGEIFSYLSTGGVLAKDVSDAIADFTAFSVLRGNQEFRIDNKTWIYSQNLEVWCCGSDIA